MPNGGGKGVGVKRIDMSHVKVSTSSMSITFMIMKAHSVRPVRPISPERH